MQKPQSQIIQEQIAEALDACQTLEDFASSENRTLDEAEQREWDGHYNRAEELKPQLDRSLKRERFKAERQQQQQGTVTIPGNVHSEPTRPSNVPYAMPERTARALQFVRPQAQAVNNGYRDGDAQAVCNAFRGEQGQFHAYAAGMQLLASGGLPAAERFCRDNGLVYYYQGREVRNDQSEGTDAAGGYTVPDPLSSEVIEFRNATGIARRVCSVWPMTSDTLRIPKLVSGQTVYYPAENAAITKSDTAWSQPQLTAVKRATLTQMSTELDEDNIVQFANRIVARAAYELAWREDVEFIQGDGTATYGNVSGLSDAVGAGGGVTASGSTWADITTGDLSAVAALLPDRHHDGASWLCSRAFFHSVVEPLILAQGGSTGLEMSGGAGRNLFGYPVNFTEAMPTSTAVSQKCLYFGNFNEGCAVGSRRAITVARSEHAAFENDALMFRLTSRYDILNHSVDWSDDSNQCVVYLVTTAS